MNRILVTCIGGHFTYEIIKSLKKENFYVAGCDIKKTKNSIFVDNFFYSLDPKKSEVNYINNILKECKKNRINIVIPTSENEVSAIANNLEKFKKKKIKVPISDNKIVKIMSDKHRIFKFLNDKNIDVGKWVLIKNIIHLKKIFKNRIFKNKIYILKPRKSSGSRGVLIINDKLDKFRYLLDDTDRFCGTGNLNSIIKELKRNKKNLRNYILMPYHQNKTFDVDCLAKNGKLILCVTRLRKYENPFSPINQGCEISNNKSISKYCEKIVNALNIDGCCDFDIVIRNDKKPQLLDSSCRLSGSCTASLQAGINIPVNLINLINNKKIYFKKIRKKITVYPQNRFESFVK